MLLEFLEISTLFYVELQWLLMDSIVVEYRTWKMKLETQNGSGLELGVNVSNRDATADNPGNLSSPNCNKDTDPLVHA